MRRWWGPRRAPWWTGLQFAAGSLCFLLAPLPSFAGAVGAARAGAILFAGSVLFTSASLLQLGASVRARLLRRLGWWAGLAQLAGALLFNLDTFEAMTAGLDVSEETELVWAPDAVGSASFLVASMLALWQVAALRRRGQGGRPAVAAANLIGSAAFGAAAVASYVVPPSGELLDPKVAAALTSIGALGFLVAAVLLLPGEPDRG